MNFTIPGKPFGKQRPKATNRTGFVKVYTPIETVNYETFIKQCFMISGGGFIPKGKAISMTVTAVYQIPKMSKVNRSKALAGEIKPLVKPDIDNIIKVVCDALNKVAYADDNQIVSITAIKYFGDEPKVTVYLEEK